MFSLTTWTKTVAAIGLVAGACQMAMAAESWTVSSDLSSLAFVSVKKSTIGEVHKIEDLSGSLAADGSFSLTLGLDSVATGIEIRDQRMREFLFETTKFAEATITGKASDARIASLPVGEAMVTDLPFTLSLHGVEKQFVAKVLVSRLNEKQLFLSSLLPVIVNTGDFGLTAGVAKLQELAGLPSIAAAVPVTLNLTLTR